MTETFSPSQNIDNNIKMKKTHKEGEKTKINKEGKETKINDTEYSIINNVFQNIPQKEKEKIKEEEEKEIIKNFLTKFYEKIKTDNSEFSEYILNNNKFPALMQRAIDFYGIENLSIDVIQKDIEDYYTVYSYIYKNGDKKLWKFPPTVLLVAYNKQGLKKDEIRKLGFFLQTEKNLDERIFLLYQILGIDFFLHDKHFISYIPNNPIDSKISQKLKKIDIDYILRLDPEKRKELVRKEEKERITINDIINKIYELEYPSSIEGKISYINTYIDSPLYGPIKKFFLKESSKDTTDTTNTTNTNKLNQNNIDKELLNFFNLKDILLIRYIIAEKLSRGNIKLEDKVQKATLGMISKYTPEEAKYILKKLLKAGIINGTEFGLQKPSENAEEIYKKIINMSDHYVQNFLLQKKINEDIITKYMKSKKINNKTIIERLTKFFSEKNIKDLNKKMLQNNGSLEIIKLELRKYGLKKFLQHNFSPEPSYISFLMDFSEFIEKDYINKQGHTNKQAENKEKKDNNNNNGGFNKLVEKIREELLTKHKKLPLGFISIIANIQALAIYKAIYNYLKEHNTSHIVNIININSFINDHKNYIQNILTSIVQDKFGKIEDKSVKDTLFSISGYNFSLNVDNNDNNDNINNINNIKKDYIDFIKKIGNQNVSYEKYKELKDMIDREKGLLSTGAISTEISQNNSLLFRNKNLNSLQIKSIQFDGVHIIEAFIPGENKIIQIKSLTLKEGNKELVTILGKKNFNINISFDKWTGDDFNKIIKTDITKNTLNTSDLTQINSFFQIYFYKLRQKRLLPNDFFNKYGVDIKHIITQPKKFGEAFSERIKNKLQIGGLKAIGTSFYLDPYDSTVKETIEDMHTPGKTERIKNEILKTENMKTLLPMEALIKGIRKAKGIKKIFHSFIGNSNDSL